MSIRRIPSRDGLYSDGVFRPRVEVTPRASIGFLASTCNPEAGAFGAQAREPARPEEPPRKCPAYGCSEVARANGRCHRHREYRETCVSPGCAVALSKNNRSGLCTEHRRAQVVTTDPPVERPPND